MMANMVILMKTLTTMDIHACCGENLEIEGPYSTLVKNIWEKTKLPVELSVEKLKH